MHQEKMAFHNGGTCGISGWFRHATSASAPTDSRPATGAEYIQEIASLATYGLHPEAGVGIHSFPSLCWEVPLNAYDMFLWLGLCFSHSDRE